jgi:hypothetical protein
MWSRGLASGRDVARPAGCLERLSEIADDVVGMLDADREAYEAVTPAASWRPGKMTCEISERPLRKFATAVAFSLGWPRRNGGVSSPCKSRKALNGESARAWLANRWDRQAAKRDRFRRLTD